MKRSIIFLDSNEAIVYCGSQFKSDRFLKVSDEKEDR
jgi:hypothetical protein